MTRTGQQGYVLITALAVLGIMGVLAYGFQSSMEFSANRATATLWEAQARYLARGGIAEARAALTQGADVGALAAVHAVPGGTVSVTVEDVRGKLHLNLAPVAEIAALLHVPAAAVSAARPIAGVHDTVAALGLSPAQYTAARMGTTVYGDGGLHFDVLPVDVLRVLQGLSPAQAEAIDRHRRGPDGQAGTADDISVNSAAGLAAVPGMDTAVAAALAQRIGREGAWFRVLAEGRAVGHGRARRTARVEALVRREGTAYRLLALVEDVPAS